MNIQQKLGILILFLMSTSLVAAKGSIMVSADTLKLYSDISRNLNVSTKSKLSKISSNIYSKIKKSPRGTNYTTMVKMELSRYFKGLTHQQRDLLNFYLYKNVYDKIESGGGKKSGGYSSTNRDRFEEHETMADDAIEEAKSSSEEAKEQFRKAMRILQKHMERNVQVVQRVTS